MLLARMKKYRDGKFWDHDEGELHSREESRGDKAVWFFGKRDSNLKLVAKEAKMLRNLRHPKVAEFVAVCSKPVAIMTEYDCFDFLPFSLDIQVSDLLAFLH